VNGAAQGHGDARAAYDAVQSLYLPVGIVVFALVVLGIAVVVWRYRARPENAAAAPTGEHKLFELGVAAVIVAIGAVLYITSFRGEDDTYARATGPRPTLRVDVVSFRWGWTFSYPAFRGVRARSSGPGVPAILRVPAGATVRFRITSRDVIHSFWLPELRFKRDLFPGRTDEFDLRFPKQTAFLGGHCAEYCGLKHSDMNFVVDVLSARDFSAWAAQQRRSPA
jgi:cytochrome c oxidase subunit 2